MSAPRRHAVVTGGGSGIGLAIARRLAAEGARVTLMGRDAARLERAAAELPDAAAVPADVTDPAGLARAFERAAERGGVDILVANAGAARSQPFLRMSAADWGEALAVNLTGAMLCCQAVLPGMAERGWGRIVAVASTAGLSGYPYVAGYVAAKHGLVGLVRALALEFARGGVTVNALCPGYTETGLLDGAAERIAAETGRSAEQARAALLRGTPLGRFVRPEEVAAAAAWLCGEAAGSVTGQAIAIDGGELA
ncbi:MAG TPA: SDR family NAD(P)-dependent oxidoreductase [Alphaproteobacteria bacterium]|nr:SDR family NAD(P)-dependent oxidoreductase [Alphaproteobacteria bacterium]